MTPWAPADSQAQEASWAAAIARDRAILRLGSIDPVQLAASAPRLVDTVDREQLLGVLRRVSPEVVAAHSGLAFAAGYAALIEGASQSGMRWLTRAQSLLQPGEALLGARIAFELGALYLAQNCAAPADVLLLDRGRSADPSMGDLLHLRALSAEAMGDQVRAVSLYRQTMLPEVEVLSPSTRVLATINLAASWNHRDPSEALALTELAIAMVAGRELHLRLRPPALNIMGYALIGLGRLREAREVLVSAATEAESRGHLRVQLYAEFNQAIIDELEGAYETAEARLRDVGDRAADHAADLTGWVRIRLVWLAWLIGDLRGATQMLAEAQSTLRSVRYSDSIVCLLALLEVSGSRPSKAIAGFESLRRSAAARGDVATELALLLRLTHLEFVVGGQQKALRHARRALAILRARSFRASPNWWSGEIVDSFIEIAQDPITGVLVRPALEHREAPEHRPVVILQMDGSSIVGRSEMQLNWRAGRTGSRMLRRLFRLLVESHPRSVQRDVLADKLWPESDGDAAISNLYAATNDLRKVLVDLPGVRLDLVPDGYHLSLDGNVHLMRTSD